MVHKRKTKEYLLHLNAKEEVFQYAYSLRYQMTDAEKILWKELKAHKLNGLKFRRQHPLHFYIADFYCHEKRLIIEVDGGIHETVTVSEHDANRTAEFERLGIRVLRFTNDQVINSISEVIAEIIKITNDS